MMIPISVSLVAKCRWEKYICTWSIDLYGVWWCTQRSRSPAVLDDVPAGSWSWNSNSLEMMSYLMGLDHQCIAYNDVLLEVSIIVINCMMYQIGLDHKRHNCFWARAPLPTSIWINVCRKCCTTLGFEHYQIDDILNVLTLNWTGLAKNGLADMSSPNAIQIDQLQNKWAIFHHK